MAINATKKWFEIFKPISPDPIMQANLDFLADPRLNKINAGIGMIMDPKSKKPFVSAILKKIGKAIAFDDNGYLPSHGHEGYLDAHARYLIFGEALWEKIKPSTVWAQTIGGTNALELSAELLSMSLLSDHKKLLLDTGWPNHPKIFKNFTITNYEHENKQTREYNHEIYISLLKKCPESSVLVLQIGGYNDDGTERSISQWKEIVAIVKSKSLIPILDFPYLGLVNGWDQDNLPVKLFAESGIICFVCASNSKNVAYNARLGSLYVINLPGNVAKNMQGTLSNTLIRPFFSNPPAFAAQVFSRILSDTTLINEYKEEVTAIRISLIDSNRKVLASVLGKQYDWITKKRGMFLKLKLDGWTDAQYTFLKSDNAIHGPKNSRLNMGGFDPSKMKEIALIYKKALEL